MERKNLGIIGGLAAAAGITFAAGNASADRFRLERPEPRENLARIIEVTGPAIVSSIIDETGTRAAATAIVGSPVNPRVGCAGEDWRLNVGPEPKAGAEFGVAHSTLPVLGEYNVTFLASPRVGDVRVAKLQCVRGGGPGPDGKIGTADDVKPDDTEDLSIEVTSVAGVHSADHDPFVYHGEEAPLDGHSEMPVELSAGVIDNVPMVGDPSQNIGAVLSAKVDPVANGLYARVPMGVTYRVGQVHETVTGVDGTEKDVSGTAHCGFLGAGWSPILAQKRVDVRVALEAGLGICRSTEIDTGEGTRVPGATDVAARFAAGVEVGSEHLAGRVGADFVVSDQDSLQQWGPNASLVVRF